MKRHLIVPKKNKKKRTKKKRKNKNKIKLNHHLRTKSNRLKTRLTRKRRRKKRINMRLYKNSETSQRTLKQISLIMSISKFSLKILKILSKDPESYSANMR